MTLYMMTFSITIQNMTLSMTTNSILIVTPSAINTECHNKTGNAECGSQYNYTQRRMPLCSVSFMMRVAIRLAMSNVVLSVTIPSIDCTYAERRYADCLGASGRACTFQNLMPN